MKTPREILLKLHQATGPKLDAIRQSAVAAVAAAYDRRTTKNADSSAVIDRRYNLREFLFSLRWHFAALSAVWLVIAFLSLTASHSPGLALSVSDRKIPPAQIIMASLRENRRELLELIQPVEWREAQPQKSILPQPRSQRCHEILTT
jgi:hypothetical protein